MVRVLLEEMMANVFLQRYGGAAVTKEYTGIKDTDMILAQQGIPLNHFYISRALGKIIKKCFKISK